MISAEPAAGTGETDDGVAWRRDLVDLLFLAPGVATSSLPKFEPLYSAASATDTKDDEDSVDMDGVHVEDDSGEGSASTPRSDPGHAVVRCTAWKLILHHYR